MKRLASILILASLLLGVGSAFAAGPSPRGVEVTHMFLNNTTPYRILLTAATRTGSSDPAQFVTVTASDSIRVVGVSTRDFLYLTAAQTALPVAYQTKVNKFLRYRVGGLPIMMQGPLVALEVYGPAGGGSVTMSVQVEY